MKAVLLSSNIPNVQFLNDLQQAIRFINKTTKLAVELTIALSPSVDEILSSTFIATRPSPADLETVRDCCSQIILSTNQVLHLLSGLMSRELDQLSPEQYRGIQGQIAEIQPPAPVLTRLNLRIKAMRHDHRDIRDVERSKNAMITAYNVFRESLLELIRNYNEDYSPKLSRNIPKIN